MKVLAWNVNHRAARRAIPTWISGAINDVAPDAVILTEYVTGLDHNRFLGELSDAGLTHSLVSERVGTSNQILMATREPLQRGHLSLPAVHTDVPPNFLHGVLADSQVQLIGFRMPMYEKAERILKRPTFEAVGRALDEIKHLPAAILGDFNTAPDAPEGNCGDCVRHLVSEGWALAIPASGHSFPANRETGTRIDYGLFSQRFRPSESAFRSTFTKLNDEAAAGYVGRPDHAMYIVEASVVGHTFSSTQ